MYLCKKYTNSKTYVVGHRRFFWGGKGAGAQNNISLNKSFILNFRKRSSSYAMAVNKKNVREKVSDYDIRKFRYLQIFKTPAKINDDDSPGFCGIIIDLKYILSHLFHAHQG